MKTKTMKDYDLNVVKSVFKRMLNDELLFDGGLCNWLSMIHLTTDLSSEHRNIAYKYIQSNRPFWTYITGDYSYWWKCNDITPMIKWLEKHITKIDKEIINRNRGI